MRYPYVLLDLDHTLIDSKAAEDAAFVIAASRSGIADPLEHLPTYITINRGLWAAVERGEMRPDDVRHLRFEQFLDTIGSDADSLAMSRTYSEGLAAETKLFPGARTVLESLAETASLGLVTNGLSDVQRTRIERLDLERYFDAIVISAEVGHTKPGPQIFDEVFLLLGNPQRDLVLMVGDSLTSDIAGGAGYGIDTCWYNPHGVSHDGVVPTFVIDRLHRLPGLIETGRLD